MKNALWLELGGCAARRQSGIGFWNSPSRTCAVRTCVGKARVHAADDVCAVGGQTSGSCVCKFALGKYQQKKVAELFMFT